MRISDWSSDVCSSDLRRMMTPEQVADAMGVSRPTISRKIKAGEIRAVKVGNRNRIPYEEFERYWRKTMGDLVELTRDELRDDKIGRASCRDRESQYVSISVLA